MNKNIGEAKAFVREFLRHYEKSGVETAICAPFLQLQALQEALSGSGVKLGAQNLYHEDKGAFTGEISGPMLKELGVDYCIIGHSERRTLLGDDDELINRQLKAAFRNGILPILCVGESLAEREEGREYVVVSGQLRKDLYEIPAEQAVQITVAYEPLWAIGTGRTATPDQAQDMCAYIRSALAELYDWKTASEMCIQYGGSVKPGNIGEIMDMPDIDGALVGGAGLDPLSLIEIINF